MELEPEWVGTFSNHPSPARSRSANQINVVQPGLNVAAPGWAGRKPSQRLKSTDRSHSTLHGVVFAIFVGGRAEADPCPHPGIGSSVLGET